MKRGKKISTAKVLMIIWLLTAAAALIVTVVYFGELQKLYSAASSIEEAGKNGAGTLVSDSGGKNTSGQGAKHEDAGNSDRAEAGEKADNPGKSDTVNSGDGKSSASISVTPAEEPQTTPTGNPDEETPSPTEAPSSEPTQEPEPTAAEDDTEHPYYYDPTLDPNKPIIALSFDDGPSVYTKRILAALDKYGAKATFFMVGYNVGYYPDEVKAVYEAGCEVANHTTDHTSLKKGSESEIRARVYDNEAAINKIVPVGEIVVRPPYGDYNDKTKKVIERPMFNWSVDSLDWKTRNADSIVAQIQQDAKDGYVILMHDIYDTTAEAAERIIPWLIEQGYQVTTVSNMFAARGEEVLPGHVYRYASPAPAAE